MPDKLTIEERLNEKIYELEEKIEKLESEAEDTLYSDAWHWRMLSKLTEEENLNLPLPRLEIRWEKFNEYNSVANYCLVMRHYLKTIERIPISSTKQGGAQRGIEDLELPFRDGVHILHDMKQTGLPAFVVSGKRSRRIYEDEFKRDSAATR